MEIIAAPEQMDSGFVLVCAAAVFLMQAGFCLLESGLVRSKNSINVAVKNSIDCAVSMLLFTLVGFGLMFGVSQSGWFGLPDLAGFWRDPKLLSLFLFQMVFCSTASTIVSGAIAERARVRVYFLAVCVLSGIAYPIIGHWAWGGLLTNTGTGWLAQIGFVDWAGATVVHVVGGSAALAAVAVIGPRRGALQKNFSSGHSLTLAILGCFILWFGWWGFNGGSGLVLDGRVPLILLNTNLGAASGAFGAVCISRALRGRIEVVDLISGLLAGLVAITAACHAVTPLTACVVGLVGAFFAIASQEILRALRLDDAVSAFPVHGAAGMWGTFAFGLFASPEFLNTPTRIQQVGVQSLGTLVAAAASFGAVFTALRIAKMFMRLRVKAADELIGLNMSEHGAANEVMQVLGAMRDHRESGDYSSKIAVEEFTEAGQIAKEYNRVLTRVEDEILSHEETNRDLFTESVRLQSVLEHAGVGIYQLAPNGRFESANSHLLKTLGYRSASELIDHDHNGLLPWHSQESDEGKLIQKAFDTGQAVSDMESLLKNDVQKLWLLESLVPVRDDQGRLLNWLGTVHDITERKIQLLEKIEVAEARSKAKGEFLANMSHEIRTPLNGVIGMMDLLASSDVDEKQAHYLGVARSSAESLLSVINDILDFSKIEAGKLEIDCIDFDLRETVETTVEQFAVRAHEKQLEMNCELDPSLPFRVEGDPDRLRQILVNLLGNALKFTEAGEVNLRVSRGEDTIRFSVQDTGIGMNREVQSRLFESFMQADGSTTRRYGGTGLGLAISSELVRQMGGEIQVRSEEGVGTEFWFDVSLPVLIERPEAIGHSMLSQFSGCRVLVVDDNSTNCEILSTQLTSWGFEAQVCQQPKTVVQRLLVAEQLNKATDLIILDFCMPEMDGRDVATAIRREPSLAHIPIVILSSNHELMTKDELFALGIQATMTKPARQSRLLDTLMSAFEAHSRREEITSARPAINPLPANGSTTWETGNASSALARNRSRSHQKPSDSRVTPPLTPTSASSSADSEARTRGSDFSLTANVLVAEDNEVNQMVATQMLTNLGLSAELASNGQEAFEKFQKNRYELILMDGHMPIMDGQTATKAIRQWEESTLNEAPNRRRTAIVALTANVLAGFREECLEIGMDDYLIKPITMERLSEVTDKYCTRFAKETRRVATTAPPPRRAIETPRNETTNATTVELTHDENAAPLAPDLRRANRVTQDRANYPAPRRITKDGRGRRVSDNPGESRFCGPLPGTADSHADAVSAQQAMPVPRSFTTEPSETANPASTSATEHAPPKTVKPTETQSTPVVATSPRVAADNNAEPKLLDSEALSARCCGDPEFERQILGIMQSNLNDRLQEISKAFDEGDIEQLTAVSHRLKGAAADSALCAVHSIAANLEAKSLEGDLDEVPTLIATLSRRVEQTIETVTEYCSQLDQSAH